MEKGMAIFLDVSLLLLTIRIAWIHLFKLFLLVHEKAKSRFNLSKDSFRDEQQLSVHLSLF